MQLKKSLIAWLLILLFPMEQLADRLKFSDPRLLEKAEYEIDLEPDWLIELRARCQQWEVRIMGWCALADGLICDFVTLALRLN